MMLQENDRARLGSHSLKKRVVMSTMGVSHQAVLIVTSLLGQLFQLSVEHEM